MGSTRRTRGGDAAGPDAIGSEGWARAWRSEMLEMIAAGKRTERLESFVKLGSRWRVWSLLRRRDGRTFFSLDDLCAANPPYGLGCSAESLSGGGSSRRAGAARKQTGGVASTPGARGLRMLPAPKPAPRPAAKAGRKVSGRVPLATAVEVPDRVQRKITMLSDVVAEAIARGEFESVAAANRALRRGQDPVARIVAAVRKLGKLDRVRLGMKLVESGLLFSKT